MALLPQVKARLSLHTHREALGLLDGVHATVRAGRSMDFNDLRDYVRGDDVKDIDWKASARTRSLLVKRYEATRQHTVLLAVSTGRSMAAHLESGVIKREVAVFAAGVIGLAAVRHGDRVGLACGSGTEQHYLPPASGDLHLERCLQQVDETTTSSAGPADLGNLLGHVARSYRRRAMVVVVCDDLEIDDAALSALRRLVVQHEVIMLFIADLDPTRLGSDATVMDVDRGTALPDWVLRDAALADAYDEALALARLSLAERLATLGIVHATVHDEASTLTTIHRLLESHRRGGRR
ncbi:DUF58 domain-containing protein [Nocardioides sp.]|uniref:DUF58 domain-containing protein n=1 Tax=Nocardioides sp. TaxID=35761 RepID=UPI002B267312|nr:DUF58 domain-containing protein [Nocardioides sp.]